MHKRSPDIMIQLSVVSDPGPSTSKVETKAPLVSDPSNQDNLFSEFRTICGKLEREPKYNGKTKIVSDFIKNGSSGSKETLYISMQSYTSFCL